MGPDEDEMAGNYRGLYLIGDKPAKKVTGVLVENLANGDTVTVSLIEYVNRRIEPPDRTLPWKEDVEAKPAAPKAKPGLGFKSEGIDLDPRMMRQRNLALLSSTGPVEPPWPPIETARTVPPEPVSETLSGQGGLQADATIPARPAPRTSFREHAKEAEGLTKALSRTIKREIERLENEGRNEPAWRDEIDFLKLVSATLDQIAAAIWEAQQAATADARERKFAEAEKLAGKLAKAGRDFAERSYERVIDYGGYSVLVILGTTLFTSMFGLSPEEALAAQLALLGLSGAKK
jgi:hypothetical protein